MKPTMLQEPLLDNTLEVASLHRIGQTSGLYDFTHSYFFISLLTYLFTYRYKYKQNINKI